MIKTLSKAQKMEREKFRIPRSVQDAIPIRRIFADGIFQVGNRYSKTWSFTDINYAIAGKEDKTAMFLDYSELLNALDSGASAKITIYNRRINKAEFERSVLLPDKDDGLDEYRHDHVLADGVLPIIQTIRLHDFLRPERNQHSGAFGGERAQGLDFAQPIR